eukprot:TRINITY_DN6514_c0_g1_i3.p1 TRINITY_DN6514_c0_g1~~TRINITY_DN6514_c0_g1_i3.p1  ORF type:complete len:310 (+),score=48.64 TRINITY_DN6514_c0_g1_i3:85-1014(+)
MFFGILCSMKEQQLGEAYHQVTGRNLGVDKRAFLEFVIALCQSLFLLSMEGWRAFVAGYTEELESRTSRHLALLDQYSSQYANGQQTSSNSQMHDTSHFNAMFASSNSGNNELRHRSRSQKYEITEFEEPSQLQQQQQQPPPIEPFNQASSYNTNQSEIPPSIPPLTNSQPPHPNHYHNFIQQIKHTYKTVQQRVTDVAFDQCIQLIDIQTRRWLNQKFGLTDRDLLILMYVGIIFGVVWTMGSMGMAFWMLSGLINGLKQIWVEIHPMAAMGLVFGVVGIAVGMGGLLWGFMLSRQYNLRERDLSRQR